MNSETATTNTNVNFSSTFFNNAYIFLCCIFTDILRNYFPDRSNKYKTNIEKDSTECKL